MKKEYYELLKKVMDKPEMELRDEMLLKDDLGIDSLKMAILYPQIEDAFGVRFSPLEDDFAEVFRTVGSLWKTVQGKL